MMPKSLLFKSIRDCAGFGVKSISFCGTGEPLLNPATPAAISLAKSLDLDCSLITNGVLATKERITDCLSALTFLRVSTTAGSPIRYAELQGSTPKDFMRMIKNLEDISLFKQKNNIETTLGVAYFLLPGCEEDLLEFTRLVREIGFDYIQVKPLGDFEKNKYTYDKYYYRKVVNLLKQCEELNTKNFKCLVRYSRFKTFIEMAENSENMPSECLALYFTAVVGSDGKVYPCGGSWYEEEHCYGSLKDNTLEQIWKSERFRQVYQKRCRITPEGCFFACRNTDINWYLHEFVNPPMHINFI
jgi:radical SAM protein with 4Fe4S-binding SPASM domain